MRIFFVAAEGVHETEHFVTGRCVHYSVYVGEREGIVRAGLYEVSKIDADPPFTVLLTDDDHIC